MTASLELKHVRRLEKMRALFVDHKRTIMRRRSWLLSEKAAAAADIQEDIDALDCALALLAPVGPLVPAGDQ